jgi:hypothetical protein
VTRENKPAAQSAARRAASLLTGALLLAGLTGCSSDLFQNSDTANLKTKPAVALTPAEGVPQKYAAKVNDQLAASLKTKGIAIVDAKEAMYVVKASYLALPEPKKGTKVTYTIDVNDKAGNKVRSITGEELVSAKRGGDAWNHVTDESVQKVALKSATDLTAWIENPNAPPPAAAVASNQPAAAPAKAAANPAPLKTAANTAPKAPRAKPQGDSASLASAVDTPAAAHPVQTAAVAPAEVIAVVPAVNGAPGDGKTSLADAMRRALSQGGIKTASATTPGAYKIQGHVELGAVSNGQQPITIRWVVTDPTGKQMEKTVVQNNKIAAGSLDGAWGQIADMAAGAAAAEVSKLINKGSGQAQAASGSAG